jgi:pimeloyl-ACP methyl ester carboxylesterase
VPENWSRATAPGGQRFVFAESGEGPLVLLIHGFPDTPLGWERIAGAVADAGYRTVRPWLRGYHPETIVHGRPFDLVTLAADPVALLDALGERDAIVVGHDWGAGLGYAAATLYPDRVRAIVPIAIPLIGALPRNLSMLWVARHFIGLNLPLAERRVRRNDFAYIERLYRRWSPRWNGAARDRTLADAKRAFADPRSLSGALDYYRALRPRPAPELTGAPAKRGLVVGGGDDLDARIYRRSAEMLADGSEAMIVAGAGHWPHREYEDAFIARLLAFLATVDQAETSSSQ